MTKKGITYVHVHVQHVQRSKNCQKSNQNITKRAPKITDFVAKLPKFCRKIYRLFSQKFRQFSREKLFMWYGDHICPTCYQLLWPEPNGSGVVASLLEVTEQRGLYQKFQNFMAQAPQPLNFTFEFIKNMPLQAPIVFLCCTIHVVAKRGTALCVDDAKGRFVAELILPSR